MIDIKVTEKKGFKVEVPFDLGEEVYTVCAWGVEKEVAMRIEISSCGTFVLNEYGGIIGRLDNIYLTEEAAEREWVRKYDN